MRLSAVFCLFWLPWFALGNADESKIVCFYESAAIEKIGYARLDPSEIDPNLCTHLVYSYVRITEDGDVQLSPSFDLPDDGGLAGFQKFNTLRKRNRKLKTLVASSGDEEEYNLYSRVIADTSLRSKFVKNVVEFVLRHEFNGFDIHWDFSTIRFRSSDMQNQFMQNYVLLLKELRAIFDEHKLILSIVVDDFRMFTQSYYNISLISSQVHLLTLNMEYHAFSDSTTGHMAPLYPAARETSCLERIRNINETVQYWLNHGAPAEKLILGTRFSGISFILNDPTEHAPGSPAIKFDENYSQPGYLNYNEICILTSQVNWTTVWDDEQRMPYSYKGNRWISYDNVRSLTEKVKYAKTMGLGGVAAWTIDTEDHRGECGEPYLLLKTLNRALGDIDSGSSSTSEASPSTEAKLFCYYASSTVTTFDYRRLEPSAIDPSLCTHLIYASVGITEEGEVHAFDPWVDLPDNKGRAGFRKFNALRKRNEKLKTLVSTGGRENEAQKFSSVAADASLRSKYAKNVVEFVLRHEFDGFDVHWNFPNLFDDSPEDVENFVLLLQELRASFDEHELILSVQVEGSELHARMIYDIPGISKYVHFILLRIVNHRPTDTVIGHNAPLYQAARETSSIALSQNIDASVRYWLDQGAPAEKLILVTPFYGLSYTLNNSADYWPGSQAIASTESNSYLAYRGYNEICRLTSQNAWTTVWDEEQRVPYSYSGNQWISYDNAKSLTEKGEYVQAMGLGGVMASSIDQDDHRGDCGQRFPLLNALNRGLRKSGSSSTPKVPSSAEIADRIKSGSVSSSVEAKIVCYYRSFTKSDAGYGRMEVSEIDPSLCTHLTYGWVDLTDDGEVRVVNPEYDLPDNFGEAGFQKFNALRKRNKKLKTLVSSGGEDGSSARYSKVAADASLRSKYVKNVVDFVLRHEFDGFDIIWISPDEDGQSPDGRKNFILLLKELRASFDKHKLVLSATVEGSEVKGIDYYDIPQMSKYVDFLVLSILCHLFKDSNTGHIAPLFPAARETSAEDRSLNFHSAIHYWLSQGAPAEKLILGTYTFGMLYTLENPAEHAPGSAVSYSSPCATLDFGRGCLEYRAMCRLISQDGWTTVWDEEQHVPYSYAGNRWISHENNRSLTEKGKYVQAMGLGGVLAWSIDMDDRRGDCGERYPSLNALNRVLRSASDVSSSSNVDMTGNEETRKICAKLNIKYVRHPENCARFWICQKLQNNTFSAEPFSCGSGLYFDTSETTCRSKDLVDCS